MSAECTRFRCAPLSALRAMRPPTLLPALSASASGSPGVPEFQQHLPSHSRRTGGSAGVMRRLHGGSLTPSAWCSRPSATGPTETVTRSTFCPSRFRTGWQHRICSLHHQVDPPLLSLHPFPLSRECILAGRVTAGAPRCRFRVVCPRNIDRGPGKFHLCCRGTSTSHGPRRFGATG
jgi:hypothetical protein